jgi:hypothetical protein
LTPEGPWKLEGASPSSRDAFQTLGKKLSPLPGASPRHASAGSLRSLSHSPALSAGEGGNDVMLFLCQVSFHLSLALRARARSPSSPTATHNRGYTAGFGDTGAQCPQSWAPGFFRSPRSPLPTDSEVPREGGLEGAALGIQRDPESEAGVVFPLLHPASRSPRALAGVTECRSLF